MKKVVSVILIVILILISTFNYAESNSNIDNNNLKDKLNIFAEGAILIDGNSMQVLYEKNPHKKLYPASTTKIMTAILALEQGNLNDIVTVDQEVVELTSGSHIALEPGEQATLEELLNVMLIGSANDSALAIAKHISGNIDVFVQQMNSKAKEIGAKNTNFVNPNGLHDDQHVSTAYDLSLIAQYAMQNDVFRNIVKEYIYTLEPTNKKTEPRFLKSNNRLVYSSRNIDVNGNIISAKYEGCNGIKTGFTKKAQSCLVSSVEKDDQYLISVVLNSDGQNVFSDSHKLFDYGFSNFKSVKLGSKNQFIDNFKISNGNPQYLSGVLNKDLYYNIPINDIDKIETSIEIEKNLKAPIKKGDTIGKIIYSIDDKAFANNNIVSTMNIEIDPSNQPYKRFVNNWYWFVFLLFFLNKLYQYNRRLKFQKKRKTIQR